MALRLHREFGSVNAVLAASPGRLSRILEDHPDAVAQIARVAGALEHCQRLDLRAPTGLMTGRTLIEFLRHRIGFEPVEVIYALYFTLKGELISDGILARGTFDRCAVHPKEIARAALDMGAAQVVIAHNHPNGDPTPSNADKQITFEIDRALRVVDARVTDHVIMGNPDFCTFRELGLL